MPSDPVRLALIVAGILAIVPGPPTGVHLAVLIGIAVLLAVSTRRSVRLATILLLLIGGMAMRIVIIDRVGSDVLDVTAAAIRQMLAGGNPYGVGYEQSRPPGASFPYGPVELLWYLPLHFRPELMEIGAAIAVAGMLAVRGHLVGLAVYAMAPFLVNTSIDGSNDTSLGLLILAAFMAAGRWPAVGAAILGFAVAFKVSALAFVPIYVIWGGWRAAGAFVAASLVAWAPVIAAWGIPSLLRSLEKASQVHRTTVWSLGDIVQDLTGKRMPVLDELRYVFGAIVTMLCLPLRRSLDGVILAGAAIYVVTLFAGNWASFAYFAALAPIICWRLDDWLGVPSRAIVAWPRRRPSIAPGAATEPETAPA